MKEIMYNQNEKYNQNKKTNKVGPIILINITLTKQQLIEELKTKTPEERAEIFAEFQKNDKENSGEKKEIQSEKEAKYAALRPIGLKHAPQITQDYRKGLEDRANVGDKEAIKEMEFFQGKFSYNADGTVNLLKLEGGKTFCADLTGNGGIRNWLDAKKLAESKGYHLLTDWNDSDKQEDKEKTDWYKLEKYFGEYTHTGAITHMLGCIPGRYWTGTTYENITGVARDRKLGRSSCGRDGDGTYDDSRVCGFKDSM